ncbi:MAG: hypothetical protein ACTS8S_17365 [Giesbergeria sp.]
MNTITRLLRWAASALVALLALLVLTLVAANWSDEPLLPEAVAMQRFAPPDAASMLRNGYFVVLGLDAPADEDAQVAGMHRFTVAAVAYQTYRQTGTWAPSTDDEKQAARTDGVFSDSTLGCTAEQPDCLRHYLAHADTAAHELQRLAPLLERYRAVDALPDYQEVVLPDPALLLPSYIPIMTASELVGIEASLLLQSGQTARALAMLSDNRHRLQRLMDGSGTLIGAMETTAAIYRQQRLMGDIVHSQPNVARDHTLALQAALGAAPLSLSAALQGEMHWAMGMYATEQQVSLAPLPSTASMAQKIGATLERTWARWTYLPQQTANLGYQRWSDIVVLPRTTADTRDSALRDMEARAHNNLGWGIGDLYPRNPAGKMFAALGSPSLYLTYLQRVQDVDAHRRMLLLQLAATAQAITPEHMAAWLAGSPPELRNPYTGEPMGWDTEQQALVFEGREEQTQNPERSATYRIKVFPD